MYNISAYFTFQQEQKGPKAAKKFKGRLRPCNDISFKNQE